MNVLILSLHGYVSANPCYGKPDTGGQVKIVLELASRLSKMGHNVDLVTRKFSNQSTVDQINDRFRIVRIPFGGLKFIRKEDMHDYLPDFIENFLEKTTHLIHYDIINSHYWDAGWAGQAIAENLNLCHVHMPHSLG